MDSTGEPVGATASAGPSAHRNGVLAPIAAGLTAALILVATLVIVRHHAASPWAAPSASASATPIVVPAYDVAADALSCSGDNAAALVEDTPNFGPRTTRHKALTDWSFLYEDRVPMSLLRPVDVQDDHELWAYTVDERIKAAMVLKSEQPTAATAEQWTLASVAACDPADFDIDADAVITSQVWSDVEGHRQPIPVIESFRVGPKHCNWEDISFLWLDYPKQEFLRDTTGHLKNFLRTTYAADVAVPPTATDTGFRRGGVELWTDSDAAYLVRDGSAQRWPRTTQDVRCA